MLRRFGPLVVLILVSGLIWAARSTGVANLHDSDTIAALKGLQAHPDPFYWFTHDWPLENHFYRPISTFFFQLDGWLWPGNSAGYATTNTLLCIACIWALYWFILELTATRWMAILSAALFGLWVSGNYAILGTLATFFYLATLIGGIARHRFKLREYVPAVFTSIFLGAMLMPNEPLTTRSVQWLPGRTATSMTLFALIALAAYARFERSGEQKLPESGYLDPPNAKSASFTKQIRLPFLWLTVAMIGMFAALGCHEQAVMLPACLLGVAILMKWQHFKVRWLTQILFWGGLIGYLVVRSRFVTFSASGYQLQQYRNGIGVLITLLTFIAPGFAGFKSFLNILTDPWIVWLNPGPWSYVSGGVSNVFGFLALRKRWVFAVGGYLLSLISFLPMAWMKMFEHYYFWPMAMRSLFVVVLGAAAWDLSVSGWSPRVLKAPARPDLAPGSLPHR